MLHCGWFCLTPMVAAPCGGFWGGLGVLVPSSFHQFQKIYSTAENSVFAMRTQPHCESLYPISTYCP